MVEKSKFELLLEKYNIPYPDCLSGIGDGWFLLLDEMFKELLNVGWNKSLGQVKEKFGGLRVYLNSGNEEFQDIVDKYEKLSYTICEQCGKDGELRDDLGWWLTLCKDHHLERKNRYI